MASTARGNAMNKSNETANWLVAVFTGWGIRESWAKIAAGAIVGALIAAGILSTTACTPATSDQAQRWYEVHRVYHSHTGTPCVVTLPDEGK